MKLFSKQKGALITAGLLASVALVAGSAGAANAGLASGTGGSGYVYVPTASPYISYAVVRSCYPTTALVSQASAHLAGVTSVGPRSVNTLDGTSSVEMRKQGTYRDGRWDCLKVG